MDKLLKTTLDLIKIKSVSGNESEIKRAIEYCCNFFGSKKVFLRQFEYPKASPVVLFSNKKTKNFDILCVAHLDVVPAIASQFKPRIVGDKLYGRGSLDMKAAVALALFDLEYVIDQKKDLAFGVLLTTDEETTSNGIKKFVKNQPDISAKIVLDPDAGCLDTIIEKYKHSVGVKLRSKGIAGHSSRPWENINAVTNLMSVIAALQKTFPQYSKKQKKPKDTWIDTMEVTGFLSPVTMNMTPDWAEATLNFRLTEKTSLKALQKLLDKACKGNDTRYEVVMASSGCYMDARSEIIQSYKKMAEQVLGQKLKITHMNGATDARMFAEKSVIIMHSLNGDGVHGENEYLEIGSLKKLAEIHKQFIDSYKA